MKIGPLVSIITPAYNAERFIADTIESVRLQTYQNWEHLIVVDQNSTDGTEKIVQRFSQQDARIKCIRSPKAKGTAANRNVGLETAQGEYVAFIDADDLWTPDKLDKQIQFMTAENADFSFTAFTRISEDGSRKGMTLNVPAKLSYEDLLKDNPIGCLTVVLKKSILKSNPFQEKGWEDMSLWLDILRAGRVGRGLNESLALYRIVKGSRSNNKIFAAKLRWQTIRDYEGLSLWRSTYYMLWYAILGVMKHRRLW